MNIDDILYGEVEINEPVLLDLINSRAMQRLKGVLQHGITAILGITNMTTRYEHSLGAALLVRRLGASLEEQAAALLHDASHTAFSHVIDYVFYGHDHQSYHEQIKPAYISGTDIPAILQRYGYDWEKVALHEEAFPLLEQPAPALCADRLDYFLRDSLGLGLASLDEARNAIQSLRGHEGRIVTASMDVARWIGYTFIAADDASWSNFREVGLYELTAQAIRIALRDQVITEGDLLKTDAEIWGRMRASDHPQLQDQMRLISPSTRFEWDEAEPTFWVSTKIRTVDPEVLVDGAVLPLSSVDQEFKDYREAYIARKTGKWPMRIAID